ncbi:MAG TPA: FAD-dependent oxidoreductase [Nocardioides sp.]|nr:FAD-dependent oxidoreductase [Nocardioides sp.]
MNARVVIVGGSVGGVRTAQALRTEGYAGHIVLVEAEDELPYDKPPLSKSLLLGKQEADDIRLLTQEQADALDVELVLGAPASGLDPAGKLLHVEGRDPLAYDDLVIATGAIAKTGPWPLRPGLHVVRTLDDARALKDELAAGGTVVVIGAGFVGAEVAATARALGLETVLVDPLPTPMSRAFEPQVGEVFLDLHRERGVDCRCGIGVAGITGDKGDFTVALSDSTSIAAATIVIGIGAAPATGWLEHTGLTVRDGVVLTETLQSVDDPNIWAVGDVARWQTTTDAETGEDIRVEHWTNAVDQAACVAHNIVHREDPRSYELAEYVWTDQYDWKIQVVGHTTGSPRKVLLGDPADRRFAWAYADADGTFIGAAVANWPKALVTFRRAMKSPSPLDTVIAPLQPVPQEAS